MGQSHLERTFEFQIKAAGLPEPEREFQFALPRRWRFDFCWIDLMIAAEVEGGLWVRGRHQRAAGFIGDCEKYNTATLLGWRVYRFASTMVNNGKALDTIEKALEQARQGEGASVGGKDEMQC